MPIDKEELQKLPPSERIKKLKELEEERKKELEEAADLIKRTEAELETNKNIPQIEVPDIQPIDISRLFEAIDGLETTVRQETVREEDNFKIEYIRSEAEFQPPYIEHEERLQEDIRVKVEDLIKYESTAAHGDRLTASRSVIKDIKKYTMG